MSTGVREVMWGPNSKWDLHWVLVIWLLVIEYFFSYGIPSLILRARIEIANNQIANNH
jgi:hypothetical protein